MEKSRSCMTERILDLTLEIIYLLIGEECIIAKKISGDQVMPNRPLSVSQRCSRKRSPKMEPPTHSLISERNNDKKILEVTQKIIELLTGEVPIRCQDVTVYFSMEEWEYLEGHKDLYKDAMMEKRPPLTSPDGSSNGNPPERCPRPLYSRDSTQEHQEDQGDCVSNLKPTQTEEEMCVNTVVQHKGKRVPTDGSESKNPQQQQCLHPFISWNCAQKDHKVSYEDQRDCRSNDKAVNTERAEDKFLMIDVKKERECWLNVETEVKEKEENKILSIDMHKKQHLHQPYYQAKATERVQNKFLRIDLQEEPECQLNNEAEINENEGNEISRIDAMNEKRDHPMNIKAKARERLQDKFLRFDVQKERECPSNFNAKVKRKEENETLRIDWQKEKHEDRSNVKAEVPPSTQDKFLRIDVQKDRDCPSNNKADLKEKEERLDMQKEKPEHQLNVKAEATERAQDKYLKIDLQKDRECQSNAKAEEKEENKTLRIDLQKQKHEHQLSMKGKAMERVEDTFSRMEMQRKRHHERRLNFKADVAERQENTFLRTDAQKEWEFPFQRSVIRNTPKRCSSPLDHWDSTQEHQKVLQDEKGKPLPNIKVEVTESDDEMYLWRDPMCKEEDVSTDGSNNRNTPERCRSPLYSWDSPLENHKNLSKYQEERLSQYQAGGRGAPEKMYGRGVEQRKEGIPSEIGSDGRYTGYNMDKCPMIFPDSEMEDDVTRDSLEEAGIDANLYSIPHGVGQSSGPSTLAGSLLGHLPPVPNRTYRRRGETFMCFECGECFTAKAKLFKHQRDHIVDKPHSCPDCGKCFVEKSHLVNHQRSHSVEKPYSCSICGKCFGEKGHLANHEKSHANEKEFFCYECGKCFTQRGHFNRHQRLHTGEKPYPCPECGKCFPHREYLIRHQRVHAGQKPFPCAECGKCFTDKYDLAKHERIHSGHRPYSCPECGRGFTQKSNLARHVRVHADYSRIHVLTVENGSLEEPSSSTISVPTKDETFLYQDMTSE
ncbi:uncharacterized protein LOC120909847 isoform X1 [Rana temporaria]|uniref:uncharacterized protein LOC120909847 isoform X1 n=1 Tax=Rana temporaria TaxID=8407 RepID=UPI001AACD570|nr:uncharacterized protein LOC120909847 isoform X1 [Rana temporaria]